MEARARDSNNGIELAHHHGISGSMSSNGILTVNWNSTNFNSATGTSTIDCSAWLEEERRKVWATAAASSGRVGSSNTIRYPSSTYGKFNTITATAHASIEDTHDAKADSFTIEVGDAGAKAYGRPYLTGSCWIDDTWVSWS